DVLVRDDAVAVNGTDDRVGGGQDADGIALTLDLPLVLLRNQPLGNEVRLESAEQSGVPEGRDTRLHVARASAHVLGLLASPDERPELRPFLGREPCLLLRGHREISTGCINTRRALG